MKLNNQEIRNCIYNGSFNKLLKELDNTPQWRRVNKMRPKQQYRYTKQELMLRFFAFQETRSHYEGHLAKFLNNYMQKHQHASPDVLASKRELFKSTVEHIEVSIFAGAVVPKLSLTVLEALLVGVGCNLPHVLQQSPSRARARYKALVEDSAFTESALREGLSKKLRVMARLQKAVDIFAT